jgi:hypothetical protein
MGRARFYDPQEWETILKIHGPVADILRKGIPK